MVVCIDLRNAQALLSYSGPNISSSIFLLTESALSPKVSFGLPTLKSVASQTRMIIKRIRHKLIVYAKKAPWQKRDNGLTARIILSFAILTILYLIFLSVLAYIGFGAIPIAVIAGIMIISQWYFSDKIVLWSTGAKIVSREQFPELQDLVERIVARNNLPKPRIAVINTKMPNAFATGKTPKSSIVTVTTGLIDELETEELEGVVAHELSHIKNRDVLVLTRASLFSTVAWDLMQFG